MRGLTYSSSMSEQHMQGKQQLPVPCGSDPRTEAELSDRRSTAEVDSGAGILVLGMSAPVMRRERGQKCARARKVCGRTVLETRCAADEFWANVTR